MATKLKTENPLERVVRPPTGDCMSWEDRKNAFETFDPKLHDPKGKFIGSLDDREAYHLFTEAGNALVDKWLAASPGKEFDEAMRRARSSSAFHQFMELA